MKSYLPSTPPMTKYFGLFFAKPKYEEYFVLRKLSTLDPQIDFNKSVWFPLQQAYFFRHL